MGYSQKCLIAIFNLFVNKLILYLYDKYHLIFTLQREPCSCYFFFTVNLIPLRNTKTNRLCAGIDMYFNKYFKLEAFLLPLFFISVYIDII